MERGIKLPQSSSEWGFKGENHLLIIGIDKYQNWKPLNNAVKDISDITKLLTERYQFDASHVIKLIDEEATEDNIRKKLLEVKKSITPEDNLVVLFSGHGHYDPDMDEGYWIPANARKDSPSDYISNSDVLKWIRSIKTHHTLIIVDSCFSGTLVSQSRSEVLSEKYPSCRIFASGRKELVDDGVPGTNSPFAKAILSRLSNNTDRVLRASELIQNVTKSVESQGGQAPIEGRIKDAGDEGGEFVFHLKVTEEDIWNAVLLANTPEEYSKYIEYFPDGKNALAARTKLSELTDEKDWKNAKELSTPQSFTQYMESHPRGSHVEEALSCLEELEENDSWQRAKTRNTVSAYMDYLRKYPQGRFDILAKKNLDGLKQELKQHEQELVHDELEGIKETTVRVLDNKEKYKTLVNAAEGLYAQMAYEKSIAQYEQALKIYESHYTPDKKFIEQRIASAKARIGYVEFLDDGKEAAEAGNYALAMEYFKKAKNIDDTPKVREWIKHCEQKLGINIITPPEIKIKEGPQNQIYVNPVAPVKKRSSGIKAVMWIIGLIVIGVIGVVIYSVVDSARSLKNSDNYSSGYVAPETNNDAITYPAENTTYAQDASAQAKQNALLPAQFIPGTWYVQDEIVNGQSSGLHPTWIFYASGELTFSDNSGTYSGAWKSVFSAISLTIGNYTASGNIVEIDNTHMILNVTESDGSITNNATFYFTRSN